jgi:hypothetical protein
VRILLLLAGCGFSAVSSSDLASTDFSFFDLASADLARTTAPGALVFVTRDAVTGDMNATKGGAPGPFGADLICNTAGAALGTTFRAWISASASGDAIDRVLGPGPWHLLDGTVAFPDRASLTTGPMVPLNLDQGGAAVPLHSPVWTGTAADGRVHPTGQADCNNWQTMGGGSSGQAGDSDAVDSKWTDATEPLCASGARLYCFESG